MRRKIPLWSGCTFSMRTEVENVINSFTTLVIHSGRCR